MQGGEELTPVTTTYKDIRSPFIIYEKRIKE